jgi:hypothetical protein
MNTTKMNEQAPADSSSRELFELELRIARRADELAQTGGSRPRRDLEHWLRAEREIMGQWLAR